MVGGDGEVCCGWVGEVGVMMVVGLVIGIVVGGVVDLSDLRSRF